ncbi:cold shock domain-containing protein [Pseudomonas aeruginosa]|jgi:cold shock CspA family protein|uniref:cold shock domain-containing protein n=1 Tax=Pseudomonas aeruginosa TaxID=287 RepID=UPI001A1AA45A|nr:cold shock domain-containing protein [Pseudomonas aeruginosa]MBH4314713.1 cold shock domain-containing protein [Pseudomonas aeruginosa]MBH8699217.1 cold shock domain-containing protein [Pseudomonas aeruginosa]HEK3608622.1 cold shock domain-containing protein [Pseudomonas aeruginosa]
MKNDQARRLTGVVRSFMPEKGFGFIQGNDQRDYFVHVSSVEGGMLVDGQSVEFDGQPSPKGYRALKVVPGDLPPPPGYAYESPKRLIWTQDSEARGFETIFVLGTAWAESNNPNEAREMLKKHCLDNGGNAVLNVNLHKYSQNEGCSNYRFTVHRYSGTIASVQKVVTTTDQDWIARSAAWHQEVEAILEANKATGKGGDQGTTRLVEPGALSHGLKLTLSWTLVLLRILGLSLVHLARFMGRLR